MKEIKQEIIDKYLAEGNQFEQQQMENQDRMVTVPIVLTCWQLDQLYYVAHESNNTMSSVVRYLLKYESTLSHKYDIICNYYKESGMGDG